MKPCNAIAVLLLVLAPGTLLAEVSDSSAAGFTVKISIGIQAAPADVYRRLIRPGDYWNPAHTFSGDAHNLSIEEKAGGCFCEKLPDGGGVRHMEVLRVSPGKILVMSGTLGPLQSVAATGAMTFQLSADGAGTKLAVTYTVGGYFPAGMNTFAGPVDSVLTEQMTRLKNSIEKGSPAPK
jgi:uncharacterized protein YndB with AHSA1/START domain